MHVFRGVSCCDHDAGRQNTFEGQLLLPPSRATRRDRPIGGGNCEGRMSLSVQNRAENVATFRFIQVFLLETVARWVPNTPELEVKVVFGRHIWDLAQQADALGKRCYELRAPLQSSLRPSESYMAFLEEFAKTSSTAEKLDNFYDIVLPSLAARYKSYVNR